MRIYRKATPAERFFTRSPYSIVTMVARIKGSVTEEMLKHAVAKVRQQHTLLQVRIRDDEDHIQWFTSEGVQEIPVGVVSRRSKDDWIKIHAEESKVPFGFDRSPPIRFVLVQSPDESDLIILRHHIICDRMNRKWAEDAEYFDHEDNLAITDAYWKHFSHEVLTIDLSEAETAALVDWSRKEGVTVNSALAAASVPVPTQPMRFHSLKNSAHWRRNHE